MNMEQVECSRCGTKVSVGQTTYDSAGQVVCDACTRQGQIVAGNKSLAAWALGRPVAVLGLLALSLVFNPLMLTALLALIVAVEGFVNVGGRQYREILGNPKVVRIRIFTGLTLLLVVLRLVIPLGLLARASFR